MLKSTSLIWLVLLSLFLAGMIAGCANYTVPGNGSTPVTANSCEGCHTDYERLIELAHQNAMLVYVWLEIPHVNERFWNEHPEWREITAAGTEATLQILTHGKDRTTTTMTTTRRR